MDTSQEDKVLSFWFDGSITENYKLKWFPSGSTDHQLLADQHISLHFSTLLDVCLTSDVLSKPDVAIKHILA